MTRGTLMFDAYTARCYYVFNDGTYDELPFTVTTSSVSIVSSVSSFSGNIYQKMNNPSVHIELECYLPEHNIRDFRSSVHFAPPHPQEPKTSWQRLDPEELK